MSLDAWKQRTSKVMADYRQRLTPLLADATVRITNLLSRLNTNNITHLVGIDLSPDFFKLAKISHSGNQMTIENFAILPVPAGIIVKDEVKDATAMSELIRTLVKQAGVESKDVALAISRSSVMIKNINIDSRLTENDIESRAWIEANRLFPDLVGNIYLDFSVSEPLANDNSLRDMTLVACRKDVINPYVDALLQAGLTARVIDVNCYALERALPLTLPAVDNLTTVALLNLNLHLSTLLVIHEGSLVYAHDQSYDGLRLKNLVEAHLKTRDASAGTPSAEDVAYMTVLKDSLSSHLRHTMHFFLSSRPNIHIQKIMLAGDCANISHLDRLIQQETGIETLIANPLLNMHTGPHVNDAELKAHQTTLMQCFGLAMTHLVRGN